MTTEILDMMIASARLNTQDATITSTSGRVETAKRKYPMEQCSSSSPAVQQCSSVAAVLLGFVFCFSSSGSSTTLKWLFCTYVILSLSPVFFRVCSVPLCFHRPPDTHHVSCAGRSGRRSQLPFNRWHTALQYTPFILVPQPYSFSFSSIPNFREQDLHVVSHNSQLRSCLCACFQGAPSYHTASSHCRVGLGQPRLQGPRSDTMHITVSGRRGCSA